MSAKTAEHEPNEQPDIIRCQNPDNCDASTIQRRRLNTQYVDEESNYMASCLGCFQDEWNYYQELWNEYYTGLL